MALSGFCPHCAVVGPWSFGSVGGGLPPTGGDYSWMETDTQATCAACGARFPVRVRVDLDTWELDRLISSPLPSAALGVMYAAARVRNHATNLVAVTVFGIAPSQTEAETILAAAGGAYDGGYEQRCVLELSAAGFRRLDGTPLHASANQVLAYA
jgi:hypothetical protein